jgi:glycosyltransferase involved in cell wall biosynthesis
MKIILPVHHFPPRYTGGAELYTFRIARWLVNHGHDIAVICIEAIDRGEPGELQADYGSYEDVRVWRLSFNMNYATDPFAWSYNNPLLRAWFDAYLHREVPDLVHLQGGYLIGAAPLDAAIAAHIPTILTLHDYWYLCPRINRLRSDGSLCRSIPEPSSCAWCLRLDQRRYSLSDRLSGGWIGSIAQRFALNESTCNVVARRSYLRSAMAAVDAVVFPSRFISEQFSPYVNPDRQHISPGSLDLTPFRGVEQRSRDTNLQIGYIGQIAHHKGVHLLIEAFRKLCMTEQQAELHIYGGLDQHPRYVASLKRLANNHPAIQFHGRFNNDKVGHILSSLDVTVVPSVCYETGPLTIMEAYAAGIPVVTTALGNMAEVVRHGVDGLHFKFGDVDDLAYQLQRLLDDPTLLCHLRAGVRPPRGIDDEMSQLLDLYSKVIAAHAPISEMAE